MAQSKNFLFETVPRRMLRRIFARQVILKCIKTPVFIETSGFFIRSALFSIDERRILKLPNVCGRAA